MLKPDEEKCVAQLLQKYKGHLTVDQIAQGIAACVENASELHDDGLALLKANRHPRAMSLFIAGMEEVGKVSVLCAMCRIPSGNQSLWAEYWKDFRSHERKATHAFVHTFADESRAYPLLIARAIAMQFELAPLGERFRQAGLYVDFAGERKSWLSPRDFPANIAQSWEQRLAVSYKRVRQLFDAGLYSVRALQLQRDVYGPINASRPKRKDLKPENQRDIAMQGIVSHKEYYRLVVREGILDPNTDIQIMGIPLREFIESGQQT